MTPYLLVATAYKGWPGKYEDPTFEVGDEFAEQKGRYECQQDYSNTESWKGHVERVLKHFVLGEIVFCTHSCDKHQRSESQLLIIYHLLVLILEEGPNPPISKKLRDPNPSALAHDFSCRRSGTGTNDTGGKWRFATSRSQFLSKVRLNHVSRL